ncbi:MAG: putative viral replication protein [Cressdnaviricota sp.]|nr:MAG: putative viral replication protein [Cressdnaviricota sp.]
MNPQEPARKNAPARHLCFTCFDVDWRPELPLNAKVRYLVFQHERASTTGSDHLQGYVEFTAPTRVTQAQRLLGLPENTHFESRKGSRTSARDYCKKEDTRVSGPWEHGEWVPDAAGIARKRRMTEQDFLEEVLTEENARDPALTFDALVMRYPSMYQHGNAIFHFAWNRLLRMRAPPIDIKLYCWQVQLIRLLRAPPQTRRIFWIWSEASSTGKTTFVRYLSRVAFPEQVVVLPWAWKDAMYAYQGQRIIVFNLPRDFLAVAHLESAARSSREDVIRAYMANLEKFSDIGEQDSGKYNSCQKVVNAHVIVTSNSSPPYHMLPDRFVEFHVDQGVVFRPEDPLGYKGPMPVVVSSPEPSDDDMPTGSDLGDLSVA